MWKVSAKWKKNQYCLLMGEDKQLRIYDSPQVVRYLHHWLIFRTCMVRIDALILLQSHRAKGLLDLSHCQILDVHSSLKLACTS